MDSRNEVLWRVRSETVDWIGKADAKASTLLALSAALAALLAGSAALAPRHWVTYFGIACLGASAVLALSAVFPRLGPRCPEDRSPYYYGHISLFTPGELADSLTVDTPDSVEFCRQLIAVADICRRKLDILRWGYVSLAVGIIFLLIGFMLK